MSASSVLVDDISNIFSVDATSHFFLKRGADQKARTNGIKFHFCDEAKTKPGGRHPARGILEDGWDIHGGFFTARFSGAIPQVV
jgi:hypothetical protein